MTDTVSLTIKIDPALKEAIRLAALENQLSLSQEVSQRLQSSLIPLHPSQVDNSKLTEEILAPLSAEELKQIRMLLKKSKKKH